MKQRYLSMMLAAAVASPMGLLAQEEVAAAEEAVVSKGAEAGNISQQLATGLFINPTAPGRDEGEAAVQYCIGILPVAGAKAADGTVAAEDTLVAQGVIAVYGLTDRIEVGPHALFAGRDQSNLSESFGGQARLQLLDGSDSFADVSVGGVLLFNDVERQTVYGALSKKIDCGDDHICPCSSITVHAGARQFWLNVDNGSDVDDAVTYAGLEIPLAGSMHLVGEVQTKADADTHQPYAAGFQVRHPDGFSCSLAAIQPGGTKGPGVYAGIGIPFN